jgi:hypothetical protein
VYRSNARNLSAYLSLSQLAKTLYLSNCCLCVLFNIIEKTAEQVLLGNKGDEGEQEEAGSRG